MNIVEGNQFDRCCVAVKGIRQAHFSLQRFVAKELNLPKFHYVGKCHGSVPSWYLMEAFNETAELYGEERLAECLNHCDARNLTVQDILKRVRRSLEEYVGNAAQSDDITMLALSRKED